MKKFLAILLGCVLVLSLAACGTKKTVEPPVVSPEVKEEVKDPVEVVETVGGWNKASELSITPEAQAVFDKALEGHEGESYQAIALVGTQVVAGTNYAFLAEVIADEVEATEVEATEVEATEVETTEAEATEAETTEVETTETEVEVANAEVTETEVEVANAEVTETEVAETEVTESVANYALVFIYEDLTGNAYFVNAVLRYSNC